METVKENILQTAETEMTKIMDDWCNNHANSCSGGEMRANRGSDIEKFVRSIIKKTGELLNIDLIAKCGNEDKKDLAINLPDGRKIIKQHQVDVHIYLNGAFIAVIECKAYLDSCYYVRACDDFKLFKKFELAIGTVMSVLLKEYALFVAPLRSVVMEAPLIIPLLVLVVLFITPSLTILLSIFLMDSPLFISSSSLHIPINSFLSFCKSNISCLYLFNSIIISSLSILVILSDSLSSDTALHV
jgi:hypothetical protein